MLENYPTNELEEEIKRRKNEEFRPNTFRIEGWGHMCYIEEKIELCVEYTTDKTYADAVKELGKIHLEDGTTLDLYVTLVKEGEVKKKESTSWFIRACIEQGVNSVMDLKPLD